MPYRRTYRKKKYGKKRTYLKKWKTRNWKRTTKKNSNRVLSKFRVTQEVTTSSGEAIGFISLSNLLYYHNANNVANAEYSSFATLYDSVRPCGVKIKWIPDANTGIAGESSTSNLYKAMYTCADYNDTIFTAPLFSNTKANILQYNNMKFKNAYRPQKWYFKLKKQPQNLSLLPSTSEPARGDVLMRPQSKFGYFDVDNMQGVDPSGTVTAKDVQAIWPNAGIFYYNIPTDGLSDETPIGTFLITYYYAFIQRR